MNKARRKELDKLRDKLEEVKSELEMSSQQRCFIIG